MYRDDGRQIISVHGITITRRLKTTLCTKAGLPALITYYQDHLKWDNRTLHALNWEVFGGV
jgi:hypothetical protein